MTQRNPQNQIKSGKNFGPSGGALNDPAATHGIQKISSGLCPACKAEVPPKPGFRFSALKCPKCGTSMAKK